MESKENLLLRKLNSDISVNQTRLFFLFIELFQIFQENAREKIRNQKKPSPPAATTHHDSESSLVVSKENTLGLITLDVSRTFPALCIFQKVCYRQNTNIDRFEDLDSVFDSMKRESTTVL